MTDDKFALNALRGARRGILGTIGPEGRPHLVPIVFALLTGGEIVTAVDHKPKSTRDLKRLHNIERDPRVTLLVDEYDEDWSRLWWVRVDGLAHVSELVPPGAAEALAEKYAAYRESPPPGPWIVIEPVSFVTWSAR
jgi:PPOX class probable F420-dependent enzyme